MGRYDPEYQCCVCGARLPVLSSRKEYIDKGCGIRLSDGSYRFFCAGNRHAQEQVIEAITGVPRFQSARVLKDRQRLI